MTARRPSAISTSIKTTEENRNLVTSFRWGWYGLAFFVPFAGILTGLFLYDQDSREVRKVGRNCLFIGFLVWVVFPVLILLVVTVFFALTAVNWIVDMVPTDSN
jgi:hypothetical protein